MNRISVIFCFFLLSFGCGNRTYSGNDWVIVELDKSLETLMGGEVREGIRWWDVVGSHFRTIDQLDPNDASVILRHAEHLPMHMGTECGSYVLDPPPPPYPSSVGGCYKETSGEIVINAYYLTYERDRGRMTETELLTIVAHEIGHSMGLRHINTGIGSTNRCVAVMTPDCDFGGITDYDKGEYDSIW